MMKFKKILIIFLFVLIFSVFSAPLVFAHDHPVLFPEDRYTEPDVLEGQPLGVVLIFWTWSLHDRIHWIFVILMLYTCYHFRFFSGKKLFGHPRACEQPRDKNYEAESGIHNYHRYFWYANIILILIHWSEVITGYGFGLDYTYTFSFQTPGIIFETFYVVAFSLWLFSCHVFKYFVGGNPCYSCSLGGRVRDKAFGKVSRFNDEHGIFMWLAILSMILLILVQGHL